MIATYILLVIELIAVFAFYALALSYRRQVKLLERDLADASNTARQLYASNGELRSTLREVRRENAKLKLL